MSTQSGRFPTGNVIAPPDAGEVNFIENWDLEDSDSSGYASYLNTAQSTPVTGAGGSANITFSSQNTIALRGDYSLEIAKDGSDRQGEGVSYDFSISDQDKSRKLKIQFDFDSQQSANYASGDLTVYIYDIDNAQLITPVDVEIPRGVDIFQTSFNSTSSSNYRLIFHIATGNGLAYDVYVDNIIVGPGLTSQGAAVGRVETYDLTISDWINNTGLGISLGRLKYQRIGGKMYVDIYCQFTGNGSSASTFSFDWQGFLNGLNLNQAVPTISSQWSGYGGNGAVGGFAGHTFITQDGSGIRFFAHHKSGDSAALLGNDVGSTSGFTYISTQFSVPITEWQDKGIIPMLSEDNLSEWTSWNPTNTQGLGTLSGVNLEFRRAGDNMDFRGWFTTGTLTASEAQLELPNSLIIGGVAGDTARAGHLLPDANVNSVEYYVIATNGDTYLNFSRNLHAGANSNPSVPGTGSGILGSSTRYSIQGSVPIKDWAGSQNSLVGYSLATEDRTGLVSSGAQTFGGDKTFNGNVGIGTSSISPWTSTYSVLQIDSTGSFYNEGSSTGIAENLYFDGSNWKYQTTGTASLFTQGNGGHNFYTVTSGTAGNNATLINKMKIDSNGEVFITDQSGVFSSDGSGALRVYGQAGITCNNKSTASSPRNQIEFYDLSGDINGTITSTATSNTTAYNTSSDARLKTNVEGFDATSMVMQMNPVQYNRTGDLEAGVERKEYGFIAQELHTILPQAVQEGGEDVKTQPWQVDYGKLTGVLTKAIQELKAEKDELKAENDELKNKLASLEERLDSAGI